MSKWLIMKIPGTTKVQLSLLTILAISSVTSTSLLISQQVKGTSVESISCRSVNLREAREELLLSQTGRDTMDRVQNLRKKLDNLANKILVELSYRYIIQRARQTTKRQDNSSKTKSSQSSLTTEPQNTTCLLYTSPSQRD